MKQNNIYQNIHQFRNISIEFRHNFTIKDFISKKNNLENFKKNNLKINIENLMTTSSLDNYYGHG